MRKKQESYNYKTPRMDTEDSQFLDAQANNYFDSEISCDMYTHLM